MSGHATIVRLKGSAGEVELMLEEGITAEPVSSSTSTDYSMRNFNRSKSDKPYLKEVISAAIELYEGINR